jgi:hypothetical protein
MVKNKNNLRIWCRSSEKVSECFAQAMENNLRTWCRSDEKYSEKLPVEYLRNLNMDRSSESCYFRPCLRCLNRIGIEYLWLQFAIPPFRERCRTTELVMQSRFGRQKWYCGCLLFGGCVSLIHYNTKLNLLVLVLFPVLVTKK